MELLSRSGTHKAIRFCHSQFTAPSAIPGASITAWLLKKVACSIQPPISRIRLLARLCLIRTLLRILVGQFGRLIIQTGYISSPVRSHLEEQSASCLPMLQVGCLRTASGSSSSTLLPRPTPRRPTMPSWTPGTTEIRRSGLASRRGSISAPSFLNRPRSQSLAWRGHAYSSVDGRSPETSSGVSGRCVSSCFLLDRKTSWESNSTSNNLEVCRG